MLTTPYLWLVDIVYWFSLFEPITDKFILSADGIATFMNFLSGIFVLLFFLGLLKITQRLFDAQKYDFNAFFHM